MKNKMLALFFMHFIVFPHYLHAEEFLQAPVFPNVDVISKTDERLELKSNANHNDVLSFYQNVLKDLPDIKYREWKAATYIEDDGKLPWHSITISKTNQPGTRIVIMKDNWTWIIGTLVLRYVAVFVVLMVLFVGMNLSGTIISKSIRKPDNKTK